MKIHSIILVAMGLMISSTVRAQKVQLNEVVSFEMPANSQKLNAATLAASAKSKNIKALALPEHPDKTNYMLDDVIISLRVSEQKQKVVLSDMKKTQDEMGRDIPGHVSKLLTVNGNAFLTNQDPITSKIWIFGTNGSGTTLIIGVLEFNEANRSTASAVLDKVLKGISYKR